MSLGCDKTPVHDLRIGSRTSTSSLRLLIFITAVVMVVLVASPVSAHGVGGRTDLPLPAWQLAWVAGFAVACSFVALGAWWAEPRLARAAVGRALLGYQAPVGTGLRVVAKLAGLFAFGVLLYASWWGNPNSAVNIAEDAFLIWFWVGMQVLSILIGDVWRLFNPYITIVETAAWVKARLRTAEISPSGSEPARIRSETEPIDRPNGSLWFATVAIAVYLWYELAYHGPGSPRSIAVFVTIYSLVMLGGAAFRGRDFVRRADGFAVLFNLFAHIAPFLASEGRIRVRWPLSGLLVLPKIAATVPFVVVVLGSTTFDGFTRSQFWFDLTGATTGWSRTFSYTVGLAVIIGLVGLAYALAVSIMAAITGDQPSELSQVIGPTLIPIAAAYAVAHYFSLGVLEGQGMFSAVSDPFGLGWDLFGTADNAIDWTVLSPSVIAWVQTSAIAVGHVMAVAAAHDCAVDRYPYRTAIRSQYPMLTLMILYTVVGLLLLLGG